MVRKSSGCQRLSVYLRNEQFIPYERERQTLADLFELPISTGSLQNFLETTAENVRPATEAIKEAVKKAEVGHVDETGFYIHGKRCWLHSVSTSELTYYDAILRFVHDFKAPGSSVHCTPIFPRFVNKVSMCGKALGSLFDDDVLMPQLTPV